MNSNAIKLQKTSRIVLAFVRIVQVILVCSVVFNAYAWGHVIGAEMPAGMESPGFVALKNISVSIIVLIVLCIVSAFLKSVQAEYTPFTNKNVMRLKTIAILIMAIEPIGIAMNSIGNMLRPISADGFKTVVHSYMGGMILLLGLIIFCISLVFEHGAYLQKQADETL